MIDNKTLESILYLSRLNVDDIEKEHFRNQIGGILEYFDLLRNYQTTGIDVDLGKAVTPGELREDVAGPGYSPEQLAGFAINFTDGFFSTPRILEDFPENKKE